MQREWQREAVLGLKSLNTDFQIVVGFYDPEFLLVHNKNNNAYFNGVVKIRANMYKASSISPGTK